MQRKGLGDDVCEVKKMGNGTWDQCLECYPHPTVEDVTCMSFATTFVYYYTYLTYI